MVKNILSKIRQSLMMQSYRSLSKLANQIRKFGFCFGFGKKSIWMTKLVLVIVFLSGVLYSNNIVNVYSLRQPFLIEPMFEKFESQTGIDVRVVYAKTGIAQRLVSEGKKSPADVILTVDIGSLTEMETLNLGQKISSYEIRKNVPSFLRGKNSQWVALTTRARVLYVSKDKYDEDADISYEDLANEEFKGQICLRSGYHRYNVALFSSLLLNHDKKWLKDWLIAVKGNLARKPQGNDRAQAKAIKEGLCSVAIGNSYYYGKMINNEDEPQQKEWANAVRLIFPNQSTTGTHINISGMLLAKYSKNKSNAKKLMDFLTKEEAQKMYAKVNYEFPVNPNVEVNFNIEELNKKFVKDKRPLTDIGKMRREVIFLLDEVEFDK